MGKLMNRKVQLENFFWSTYTVREKTLHLKIFVDRENMSIPIQNKGQCGVTKSLTPLLAIKLHITVFYLNSLAVVLLV